MASPSPPSATELWWDVQMVRLGNLTLPSARLRSRLYFRTVLPGQPTVSQRCWLDTGAPLSVVPFDVHAQGLAWQPLAGVQTTWAGQPCDLGYIDVWLPTSGSTSPRGPFSVLAKFAHSDPPGVPLPVLLGLEFLLTHHAALSLPPPPQPGAIRLP